MIIVHPGRRKWGVELSNKRLDINELFVFELTKVSRA
jgi:hypothetical protein